MKTDAKVRLRSQTRVQVLTRICINCVKKLSGALRQETEHYNISPVFPIIFRAYRDITNSSIFFKLRHIPAFHPSSQQNMARCPSCGANPIGTGTVTYPCDNPSCDRGNLTHPCNVEGCNGGRYWAPAQRKWLTCQRCHGSGQVRTLETCHRCHGTGTLVRPCPTCLINRVSFG